MNQVILNFLDRMIDENVKHADALSQLRSAIAEQRVEVDELTKEIRDNRGSVTNKLNDLHERQNDLLRDILSRLETKDDAKERKEFYKKVDKFIETVKSPKTWIALIVSAIIGLTGLVGGVATIVYRLPNLVKDPDTTVVQPQSQPSTSNPTQGP
tara:strand:- start:478753 stop:479217 length:465 start_codon:yes stop_codon:yes gene_type:complete